jgi:hypothetical protein
MMRIISLGAGVQSTTMALMAARGEMTPMPDCAIFADTQDEPMAVYDHLHWLMSPNVLPFPVHIVTNGKLSERLLQGDDEARIPFHFGAGGLPKRQCTRNYKIRPIRRKVRELLGEGYAAPASVEMWIGISLDEASRMKMSDVRYIVNRWPLIERRMTRRDCLSWLKSQGYPRPPRSACVYCPYKNDREWRELRDGHPSDWNLAVEVDRRIRSPEQVARLGGEMFAHRSRVPLPDADLTTLEDHGQLNLFNNECEGMCGV